MQTLTRSEVAPDRRVPMLLALWVALALGIALSGVIAPERIPAVPVIFLGTLAALVLAWWRSPAMRTFCDRLDLRVPILFHLVRIAFGGAFLVLASRGELDPVFGLRAGWGDILAGLLAIPAAIAAPRGTRASRVIVYVFNVIGLIDIVMVFATAQSILFFSGHPETMSVIARFPLSTIPPLVLPLIYATHFLIFQRLRAAGRSS